METILRTSECAWSETSMQMLGRKFKYLRGFELKYSVEKEHVYASGSMPADINSGNEKPEGNIKMLKIEADMFNKAARDAGYKTILHVPHTLVTIVCQYKKSELDPIEVITVPGVAFTEMGFAMEQNAKFSEVTFPFIAMDFEITTL